MLIPEEWHKRYQTQARWTEEVRRYLFQQSMFSSAQRVLEVGCGTGAITSDIQVQPREEAPQVFGLDIRTDVLQFAHRQDAASHFTCGDGLNLPFSNQSMDITFCHFYLLWLKKPMQGLLEMLRVTQKGGVVMAMAEPDYGGRIDYPPPLDDLGRMQAEALRYQGAEPEMGRRLSALFYQAGLKNVQTGLLGGQWNAPSSSWDLKSEWAMYENDLTGLMPEGSLNELKCLDYEAWQSGRRVLYVPTFYALGQVL